jgi:hypothetical protein
MHFLLQINGQIFKILLLDDYFIFSEDLVIPLILDLFFRRVRRRG